LKYNLQTVRAYLQRKDFQRFWRACDAFHARAHEESGTDGAVACRAGPELVHCQGKKNNDPP
jgi:hypothetical protein